MRHSPDPAQADHCLDPFSSEMMSGGEDILDQLSAELELGADFMDFETDTLYGQLVGSADDHRDSIFTDVINETPLLTPDTVSLKSEPFSPLGSDVPPSPSSSEHSDDALGITLVLENAATPLSPPYSPTGGLAAPEQQVQFISSNGGLAQVVVKNGSVVRLAEMPNLKLPIPKVTKPTVMRKTPQPRIMVASPQTATPVTSVLGVQTMPMSSQTPIIIKREQLSPVANAMTTAMPTVPTFALATSQAAPQEFDLKTLKRHQRMIKNRESACLSRKKKKEYVTSLEDQMNSLARENTELRRENEVLKARVRELESEKTLWIDTVLNRSHLKKGTALFAILFMVSLNFSSMAGLYERQAPLPSSPSSHIVQRRSAAHSGGRTLLWADDNDTQTAPGANVSIVCPFFNESESLRLESQLRGWFKVGPHPANPAESPLKTAPAASAPTTTTTQTTATATASSTSLDYYTKPAVQSLTGGMYHLLISESAWRHKASPSPSMSNRGELTLYESNTPRFTYESFFEAIEKREDTFYVVSFSGDHLLLPASTHNQTSRPRMSLLLPALTVPINESMQPPKNHVAMMQIDCEVMNTRLIHIRQDAIPMQFNMPTQPSADRGSNVSLQSNVSNDAKLKAAMNDSMNALLDGDSLAWRNGIKNFPADADLHGGDDGRVVSGGLADSNRNEYKYRSRRPRTRNSLYKRSNHSNAGNLSEAVAVAA